MNYPIPKKIPHTLSLHNHQRVDDYFWMRDRENADVIEHLNAENTYTDSILAPTKNLQEELFKEMKGRIKEDDSSAPFFKNGYWYYSRFEEGLEHVFYCRKKGTLDAPEEILINENIAAENHAYYEIVAFAVSKNNKIIAFTEDISGRRLYQIRFKNLETGELLPHCIENTGSDLAWLNDDHTLYYSIKDSDTLRPYLVQSIDINTGIIANIYEEVDDTYIITVNRSGDFQYIFIGCHSTLTTEFRFKSANDTVDFEIFLPRQEKHEYYPESAGGDFFIKSNMDAKNFKVAICKKNERHWDNWKIIQEHDLDVLIEDFDVFNTHLVVQEKENGLSRLKVYDRANYTAKIIPPSEETYTLYLGNNPEPNSNAVRIGYSSMTTPNSVIKIDLKSFEQTILKQQEVIGDFDPTHYQSERTWATAADGMKVPTSVIYKKELFKKDGTNPILVYAYGSYGSTVDPYFSSSRLSLLDRGFVFAIAHIRGGEYLGTNWYDEGKLLKKKNTFTDFISVTEHLIADNYCAPERVFAMGGSAGGLLMGAIANLRPELWKGIVSQVPFVDVISTMIDETIPLTTGEYDEWGNPNVKTYYDYMLSYSPYDQLEAKDYPAMLVTSGLHDSQVQYWEPTKYVAKLRELKTDQNPILLRTNMDAGHGGSAGRFEQLKEVAEDYAFILWMNKNN
ncbi:MAG: prolyl oligopeptidase family serine peptidase [Crocinitomix sp.]|nr:prolyl oligopeptidase family serine peptidase [Crocinitomix sp.]